MPKRTALYDRHIAAGAKMVSFAGWELPIQYRTGPKEEHLIVRRAAGLFDIDHMGQITISGPDALPFLQRMLTSNIAAIAPQRAGYALMCYADGGVVDDTFVYNIADRYMVVVNASNVRKDERWLRWHSTPFDVTIENISETTYMLALQGPSAATILDAVDADGTTASLEHHGCQQIELFGASVIIGRTGYTGEDGFELYIPTQQAVDAWDALMEAGSPLGLAPIGLAARDSLRLEPCMPLYGQEIGPDRTPIQAGLGWAVSFTKGGFLGRDALAKERLEGAKRRLVAIEMIDRGVPRHGYPIVDGNETIGEVTSGIYSPTLDAFIAMAYVPRALAAIGTELSVSIRGKSRQAVVVKKPFYRAPQHR